MLNCRDCLNFKIILSESTGRCTERRWNKKNIRLGAYEVIKIELEDRKIFKMANNCRGFISMDD